MSALLWYAHQVFSVSNSVKDLLYEVAVEVAKRDDPAAHQRLAEDGRLIGCYGVSGMGFDLEAFVEAFGSKQAWQASTARHAEAARALYPTPACARLMAKLFSWIWFLLEGGQCSDAPGDYPDLETMPEFPGPLPGKSAAVRDQSCELTVEPGLSTKFVLGIAIGAFIGTAVGVTNILLGLVNNWLTVPAWALSGALLGTAHPLAEAVLKMILRIFDR
jgi:hypothetical protein